MSTTTATPAPSTPRKPRKRKPKAPVAAAPGDSLAIDGMAVFAARTKAGLTQAALGKSVGVSPSYISDIENGRRTLAFNTRLREQIAAALDVDVSKIQGKR